MTEILYLATDFFLKGGIQRYSRAQVNALQSDRRNEVTVLSVHSPGNNAFEEPFQTHYNGDGTTLLSRIKFMAVSTQLAFNGRYDVAWVNHVSLSPLAVVLAKMFRIPHIILNVYGLEMWSGLRWYEQVALHHLPVIISDCHFTARYMQDAFAISPKRLHVIWDPVDTQRFHPQNSAFWVLPRYGVAYSPEKTYLMTLGRVSVGSRHKGYDRMLDIMKDIQRDDIVYLIVGDGDDRRRLEHRVATEGLHDRVFFLGAIPESDLVAVYNAADIFVLVSDRGDGRGEGVPLTPLEAASCGKPIIVGDEDGSPEAVQDGISGYIVSPRDKDLIRKRILTLVDNPEKRRNMGKMAREHIVAEFSYDVFREKNLAILTTLGQ